MLSANLLACGLQTSDATLGQVEILGAWVRGWGGGWSRETTWVK